MAQLQLSRHLNDENNSLITSKPTSMEYAYSKDEMKFSYIKNNSSKNLPQIFLSKLLKVIKQREYDVREIILCISTKITLKIN